VRVMSTPITPGRYSANIYFFSPAGTTSPTNVVPVTLTVGAIGSGNLIVSPSSLTFNYFCGAQFPQSQSLSIGSSTGASVPFSLNAYTVTGGPWLSVGTNNYFTPSYATVSAIP